MSDYFDPNSEELLKDFYIEATQQVEILERNILALEDDPSDRDAVDEIFRAAHTLKGGAATVQMNELSSFTHKVEDLLDEIRSDNVKISTTVVDLLLESVDVVKIMLQTRQEGSIYEEDIEELKSKLEQLKPGAPASATAQDKKTAVSAQSTATSKPAKSDSVLSEYDILELKEAAGEVDVLKVEVHFDKDNPMNSVGGIQVFARLKELGQVLRTIPDFDKLYEDTFYPVVEYYIASQVSCKDVEEKAFISEVTISVNASDLGESGSVEIPETSKAVEEAVKEKEEKHPVKEALEDEVDDEHSIEKEIEEAQQKSKAQAKDNPKQKTKVKDNAVSSILRVESKRIDNLLNLVSEAVINKATFNQISTQFTELQNELNAAELEYKEKLKNLFEELPQYLEQLQTQNSVKEFKKEIQEKYGDIFHSFDSFGNGLKSTIATFKNTAANLGRNTGDLHEGILRIRMVPINQIFSRFPRLVRDLCRSLDKKVELVIEGEDTELDKSVTEQLLDPLMHCVRNSIDHGIEIPEVRKKNNKDETGKLLLKASNEGNMIVIEIADDGAGIDVDRVRKKAVDNGIIHPNKSLSDLEAYNLIFEPGFSTAKDVTNISGRGVGLDVVKKEIEKLNGSVNVWSSPGNGTKFTVKLPLTLAIIQGLLVKVGQEIYAIPITSVVESHRIKPDEINIIDNYEVFNVRSDVISLIRLDKLFRIETEKQREYLFVVIVGSGDKKMGLVVDSLIGEEDVVIKPLKDRYTNSPGIAGATILGDGTVSLIIDVSQLLDLGVQRAQENRFDNSYNFS